MNVFPRVSRPPLSLGTTQRAPSPTRTWNWRHPSPNRTCWSTPLTYGNGPSIRAPTTPPPSTGNVKDPPPLRKTRPNSFVFRLSISATTAIVPSFPTSPGLSTPWLMTPLVCGTCLTHNCLLISMPHIHSNFLGVCAASIPRRSPL